jgi:hypothetical protein
MHHEVDTCVPAAFPQRVFATIFTDLHLHSNTVLHDTAAAACRTLDPDWGEEFYLEWSEVAAGERCILRSYSSQCKLILSISVKFSVFIAL